MKSVILKLLLRNYFSIVLNGRLGTHIKESLKAMVAKGSNIITKVIDTKIKKIIKSARRDDGKRFFIENSHLDLIKNPTDLFFYDMAKAMSSRPTFTNYEEARPFFSSLESDFLSHLRRFRLSNQIIMSGLNMPTNVELSLGVGSDNGDLSSEGFDKMSSGLVVSYKDGVVVAIGLPLVRVNELVLFRNGATGVALNLERSVVKALVFNDVGSLRAGESIYASGFLLRIGVGSALLGRVIDPLGVVLDGCGDLDNLKFFPIERKAPGVITRKKISQPLHTGIRIIDSLIPIGRGQRELILGDRKTGKTSIVLDTFINQT